MAIHVSGHIRKNRTERRQEILDAALEVLGEHGLEGATVTRIAEAAGLTPGALYRHFPNRDAIFEAAHQVANQQAASWIDTSTEPDVIDRLEALADTHAEWGKSHLWSVVRPFFQALAFSPRANLANQMTLPKMQIFRAILEMVEEGKKQGSIREDVDPANVVWAMLMFAWIEDIALMVGGEEFIEKGTLKQNLRVILESFRPHTSPSNEEK